MEARGQVSDAEHVGYDERRAAAENNVEGRVRGGVVRHLRADAQQHQAGADGGAILGTRASTNVLRSIDGGCQGDGGSTIMCVGAYHEDCREVHRMPEFRDTDMTATADDFYVHADVEPAGDGLPALLFQCYAVKRDVCKANSNLSSNLPKTALHSPEGDISLAPTDIPGSPNYECDDPLLQRKLRQRVDVIKVAGTFIGAPEACSAHLLDLIKAKLKPLTYVRRMLDLGRVGHARMLQVHLLRLCATAIPNHWTRTMPPEQTADAAAYADAAIREAAYDVLRLRDSPADRADLAYLRAQQPSRLGGLGLANYTPKLAFHYAAGFTGSWPACCSVCPALRSLSVTDPTTPSTTAFAAAWSTIDSTLSSVRSRHAALDAVKRTWIDRSTHSAFHPALAASFKLPPIADLFDDAPSTTASRLSQRSLVAVFNNEAWMDAKLACDAFDAANLGADVPHREATGLISHSQEGSGAWISRLPDHSVAGSIISSASFLAMCQRRLSLYLSCLAPVLDEKARRGAHVTQHQRLGDEYLNAANSTNRHNDGLRAAFTALTALSTSTQPPGTLKLGDRGDGTRVSKEEARRRYAHINDGHVPDIVRHGTPPSCYEYKCYTPFLPDGALGLGSNGCGGAASATDGHFIAFGNTEEALRAVVFGQTEHGDASEGPFNRVTGTGWVRQEPGQYTDAISKGHPIVLLGMESTGAMFHPLALLLKLLGRQSTAPGTHDSTTYGDTRASPKTFYRHHSAALSAAVTSADATVLLNVAAALSFELTYALPPLPINSL